MPATMVFFVGNNLDKPKQLYSQVCHKITLEDV